MSFGRIRIYKLKKHNRWVAKHYDGGIIIMGHSWASVLWQLSVLEKTAPAPWAGREENANHRPRP